VPANAGKPPVRYRGRRRGVSAFSVRANVLHHSQLVQAFSTVILLSLFVSCHPDGCYGPESFGYNTKGVAVSNLFGTYVFDGANTSVLNKKGFTNHSGSIQLKPDMTFVFSEVPFIMNVPQSGVYVSISGKWRAVQTKATWAVEVYDVDFKSMGGYGALTFPILGEHPPHGIELAINHAEGYYIRYRWSQNAR